MPIVVVGGAVAGAYGFQKVRANCLLRPPDGYDGLAQDDQELGESESAWNPLLQLPAETSGERWRRLVREVEQMRQSGGADRGPGAARPRAGQSHG